MAPYRIWDPAVDPPPSPTRKRASGYHVPLAYRSCARCRVVLIVRLSLFRLLFCLWSSFSCRLSLAVWVLLLICLWISVGWSSVLVGLGFFSGLAARPSRSLSHKERSRKGVRRAVADPLPRGGPGCLTFSPLPQKTKWRVLRREATQGHNPRTKHPYRNHFEWSNQGHLGGTRRDSAPPGKVDSPDRTTKTSYEALSGH